LLWGANYERGGDRVWSNVGWENQTFGKSNKEVRMNKRLSKWGLLVLVGLLCLALVAFPACTSNGEEQEEEEEELTPILLGATFSLSSPIGQEQQNAAQLAVDEINADGGLLGREVDLIVYDDGADATVAAAAVLKLCTQDNVDVIIGGMSSITSLGAVSALKTYQKVTVWLGGASHLFEEAMVGCDWFFHIHPWDYMQAAQQWVALTTVSADGNFPIDKIFVAYEDSAFGAGSYALLQASLIPLGYDLTGQSFTSAYLGGSGDFGSLVAAAAAFDPDYFAFIGYDADVQPLLNTMKEQAFNPPFILGAPPSWPVDFGSNPLSEGITGYTMWTPALKDISPAALAFFDAYVAEYGKEPPDYIGPLTYDNVMIVADAIERAGTLDKAALITALEATDYDSAVGDNDVVFAPSNNITHQASFTVKLFQWQDGIAQIIYPYEVATADLIYPHPAWLS
jgi:branched-chain amino acid transport system substrate-binding protein